MDEFRVSVCHETLQPGNFEQIVLSQPNLLQGMMVMRIQMEKGRAAYVPSGASWRQGARKCWTEIIMKRNALILVAEYRIRQHAV